MRLLLELSVVVLAERFGGKKQKQTAYLSHNVRILSLL